MHYLSKWKREIEIAELPNILDAFGSPSSKEWILYSLHKIGVDYDVQSLTQDEVCKLLKVFWSGTYIERESADTCFTYVPRAKSMTLSLPFARALWPQNCSHITIPASYSNLSTYDFIDLLTAEKRSGFLTLHEEGGKTISVPIEASQEVIYAKRPVSWGDTAYILFWPILGLLVVAWILYVAEAKLAEKSKEENKKESAN